ncbi:MAG: hypothetical protein AAF085_16520 [Planctomycetota bacterium]
MKPLKLGAILILLAMLGCTLFGVTMALFGGAADRREGLIIFIIGITTILVICALWWHLLKRLPKTHDSSEFLCPECGYNMRGLSQAKCPECGAEFTLDQLKLREE